MIIKEAKFIKSSSNLSECPIIKLPEYVFLGRSNVGKSSLINALAEESESIVSDIPGTTRDAISYNLKISSFNITVIDTAGLRESKDNLEIQGIERTKKAIKKSIEKIFKVNVIKINIINKHSRKKITRGKKVKIAGYKKAIITLKKGQNIDLTTGI